MRVLIIATTKFEMDGITHVILNYYRAMDKSGMQIDFAVPNELDAGLRQELEQAGSAIYRLNSRLKHPLAYIRQLSRLVRENKYDIVHAHGNSATLYLEMIAAKKGGARVRLPHSHNTTCRHKLVDKLLRPMFYKSYTHGFACGQKAGEWLFGSRPFEIINNGIDLSKYSFDAQIRENYRSQYGFAEKKVIGHVGTFNYQKNHEFLIDIFSELYKLDPSYRLLLVGDGTLKEETEQKVTALKLNDAVTFAGKTPEVPGLLQAMDMLVLPSRYEGLPLTLIEAQAACLPCFVSDVVSPEAGVTELVSYIPLEEPANKWAQIIHGAVAVDREAIRDRIHSNLTDAGYSIYNNARHMKSLYSEYLHKGK
ncbi:MAG TPA: glycosyltransferase family 1 protein [Candidatus Atribacteria bacterium]|nr:glycosyltransferase family 1 protein [Candidatus Atribacteria bacterium]